MGGFQAVAAGLGEAGEQTGQGINQAITEALKVRAQTHLEDVDKAHITLAQQAQQQAYQIAQQQHELTRQQIISNGWKDMGSTVGPDGKYVRNFYNDQTKENRAIPMSGTPPDSPQNLVNYYKTLRGMTDGKGTPLFTDMQSKQVAFKMPQLYREGPVGMVEGFRDHATELLEQGIKQVKIPGIGKIDISTPQGAANYAQAMMDVIYQRGMMSAYLRSQTQGRDMTGFTPGEQRDYKSAEAGLDSYSSILQKTVGAALASELNPQKRDEMMKTMLTQTEAIEGAKVDKYNEIVARRHPERIDKDKPLTGKLFIQSQWAANNPGKDANAAAAEARKQGAIVLP